MIRVACLLGILMITSPALAKGDEEDPVILQPTGEPYEVREGLIGKKKEEKDGYKKAKDISGIACMPGKAPRRCLIVNDENREAQFVTIDGRTITPGAIVPLIGTAPSTATLGAPPPRHDCPKGDQGFENLDGEAVAYAGSHFYVAGSHGCSRNGAFNLSNFILARIPVDATGAQTKPAETSYRLSDALLAADIVGPHFAQDLETLEHANGLNVEGLAIVDGQMFLGLRAPTLDGVAYIVSVPLEGLFAAGHERLKDRPVTLPVPVGEKAGIRDLAVLPDKRLLVLTGPAQDQKNLPYKLLAVEPRRGGASTPLGQLADLDDRKGKAEALTLLGDGRVLILFDSLKDGAPREYPLP